MKEIRIVYPDKKRERSDQLLQEIDPNPGKSARVPTEVVCHSVGLGLRGEITFLSPVAKDNPDQTNFFKVLGV